VKVIFGRQFQTGLLKEEMKYRQISDRLASAFRGRIAGLVREIVQTKGGDHVGPHGFPCRRTKPFPFYVYYQIRADALYILGLVHERRHPDFLKKQLRGGENQ
jgi:hypothetical protein